MCKYCISVQLHTCAYLFYMQVNKIVVEPFLSSIKTDFPPVFGHKGGHKCCFVIKLAIFNSDIIVQSGPNFAGNFCTLEFNVLFVKLYMSNIVSYNYKTTSYSCAFLCMETSSLY